MVDQRLDLLEDWLAQFFADENFVISKASDDASFRRYFRIERDNNTFIAMDAPPEKENTQIFVEIATLLRAHQLHAPKIIEQDLTRGFLLLEDLGNTTLLQKLKTQFDEQYYRDAIDEIIKIQRIQAPNVPSYDAKLLAQEMQLLIDWYLDKDLDDKTLSQLKTLFAQLIDNALQSQQVLVHRDYHSRNLMHLNDNTLAVIDFQDAVIGAQSYDLVSLLKDAYFELEPTQQQDLLRYYYQQAGITEDFASFEKQFDLMGLQRHLKVLGIFKRLSIRDHKHQYLADIPLVKRYALEVAHKYPECQFLSEIL